MEARVAAAKSSYKRLLKAQFFDVYKSDNHIVYYNFCQ